MSIATPTSRTPVIDARVHAYERDRPERPWVVWLQGPPETTGDQMVAAMDAVGVRRCAAGLAVEHVPLRRQ